MIYRSRIFILTAFVVITGAASGQNLDFIQLDGPYGGVITNIYATSANVLYAMPKMTGLYRSTDMGASWERLGGGIEAQHVNGVAELPGGSLAAATDEAVYRSENGGRDWTLAYFTGKPVTTIIQLESGVTVFCTENALFRAENNLADISDVTPGTGTISQIYSPGGAAVFAGIGSSVWKSSDAGATWDRKALLYLRNFMNFASSGNTTMVTDSEGRWAATADGGETWSSFSNIPTQPEPLFIMQLYETRNAIFAQTYDSHLLRTFDAGESWEIVNDQNIFLHLIETGDGTLFGCGGRAIDRSTDMGRTWQVSSNGIYEFTHWTFTEGENDFLYVTSGEKIMRFSTDDGITWTEGRGAAYGAVLFPGNGKKYFGTLDGVFSANEGQTDWTYTSMPGAGYIFNIISYTATGELFATSNKNLFVSTDQGATFTAIPHPAVTSTSFPFDIKEDSKGNLYTASVNGGVHRSTDGGSSWEKKFENGAYTLYISPGDNIYAMNFVEDFWRSTDGGATWELLSAGSGVIPFSLVESGDGTLYAATTAGVLRSGDGGDTWSEAGLPVVAVGVAIDRSGRLLVATDRTGVYRSSASTSVPGVPADQDFALFGNYPNPVASQRQTEISYTLPTADDVQIDLYNTLGMKVMQLYNGAASQGANRITMNTASLSPGQYRYAVRTRFGTQSRWLSIVQ